MKNGWRLGGKIPKHFTPTKTARKEAERKLKKQSWWKPTRPIDQARMLSPTKSMSDIQLLRNIDNIPNPHYRTWARRKTGRAPPTVIDRFTGFKQSIPKISKKHKNESYENWALRHDQYMMKYHPYNFWA